MEADRIADERTRQDQMDAMIAEENERQARMMVEQQAEADRIANLGKTFHSNGNMASYMTFDGYNTTTQHYAEDGMTLIKTRFENLSGWFEVRNSNGQLMEQNIPGGAYTVYYSNGAVKDEHLMDSSGFTDRHYNESGQLESINYYLPNGGMYRSETWNGMWKMSEQEYYINSDQTIGALKSTSYWENSWMLISQSSYDQHGNITSRYTSTEGYVDSSQTYTGMSMGNNPQITTTYQTLTGKPIYRSYYYDGTMASYGMGYDPNYYANVTQNLVTGEDLVNGNTYYFDGSFYSSNTGQRRLELGNGSYRIGDNKNYTVYSSSNVPMSSHSDDGMGNTSSTDYDSNGSITNSYNSNGDWTKYESTSGYTVTSGESGHGSGTIRSWNKTEDNTGRIIHNSYSDNSGYYSWNMGYSNSITAYSYDWNNGNVSESTSYSDGSGFSKRMENGITIERQNYQPVSWSSAAYTYAGNTSYAANGASQAPAWMETRTNAQGWVVYAAESYPDGNLTENYYEDVSWSAGYGSRSSNYRTVKTSPDGTVDDYNGSTGAHTVRNDSQQMVKLFGSIASGETWDLDLGNGQSYGISNTGSSSDYTVYRQGQIVEVVRGYYRMTFSETDGKLTGFAQNNSNWDPNSSWSDISFDPSQTNVVVKHDDRFSSSQAYFDAEGYDVYGFNKNGADRDGKNRDGSLYVESAASEPVVASSAPIGSVSTQPAATTMGSLDLLNGMMAVQTAQAQQTQGAGTNTTFTNSLSASTQPSDLSSQPIS